MDSLTTQVGKRAQEIRRLEEGLEAGRFEHLDREFQERVHALRVEENALKARSVGDTCCLLSLQP